MKEKCLFNWNFLELYFKLLGKCEKEDNLCVGETFEVARCVMSVGSFVDLYQSMKEMNECLRLSAVSMKTMKTILTSSDTTLSGLSECLG